MKNTLVMDEISSNINEGIKAVLIFYKKISHAQKAQKAHNVSKQLSLRCFLYAQKAQKAQNVKQATFTQTFYTHTKSIKSIKSTKRQTSNFLPFRCFYVHKNVVFFVLHTKKHKKYITSTKTHIDKQATFFPLDVF